jgi:hypothetical protein
MLSRAERSRRLKYPQQVKLSLDVSWNLILDEWRLKRWNPAREDQESPQSNSLELEMIGRAGVADVALWEKYHRYTNAGLMCQLLDNKIKACHVEKGFLTAEIVVYNRCLESSSAEHLKLGHRLT